MRAHFLGGAAAAGEVGGTEDGEEGDGGSTADCGELGEDDEVGELAGAEGSFFLLPNILRMLNLWDLEREREERSFGETMSSKVAGERGVAEPSAATLLATLAMMSMCSSE